MGKLDYKSNQTLRSDKILVISDSKSCSIRFNNALQKKVYQVKVDEGLIKNDSTNQFKKCDYLIYTVDDDELVAFIELKGNHIEHAIKQLESTIKITYSKFKDYETKKCFISSNSSPKTQFRKKQLKFQNDYKIPLYLCRPNQLNKLWD